MSGTRTANWELRTEVTAIDSCAPQVMVRNPTTSARPHRTMSGSTSRGSRSRPVTSSGSATNSVPRIRPATTIHAPGTDWLA
ncbi:MAG: hypothetical protein U0667_13190 [Chloroflexota bacterium]